MKINKIVLLFIVLLLLTSCSSKTKVPEAVTTGAKSAFDYDSWSENNYGVWRGGGWHLLEADKNSQFTITNAEKGMVPDDLKVLMSGGQESFTGNVYCLNISPTLYFGYGDPVNNDVSTKNFLMFENTFNEWRELGQVWNEPWVAFLYPPDTYHVSTNFYMGVTKSMFEMMGCDNWAE